MLEHVYERAKYAKNLNHIVIATCDKKFLILLEAKKYNVIMTSSKHVRALDRVYEASKKLSKKLKMGQNDITICIQADEPMLDPKMIEKIHKFFNK